jgi:hypothetical protein
MLFIVIRPAGCQDDPMKPQTSMAVSCGMKPYLSVSLSTPKRNAASFIQMMLVDPLGRAQGHGVRQRIIPGSRYQNITEIPSLPHRSKARSVEICGARQGEYELTLYERGNEHYRLTIEGKDGQRDSEFQPLHLTSTEGRVRHFRFLFEIANRQVSVMWVGDDRRPQSRIQNNEW